MDFEALINQDIKSAMLAREKDRLEALRAIKAGILLAKTAEGGAGTVTEAEAMKMLQKMVKQRRDSAEIYTTQNRPELAAKELMESAFIEAYLPKQMSDQEVDAFLRALIAELGASSPKDMGKVMGQATKQLAGKADGKLVAERVKALLNS
ncbi:MAG: GatB/YqeY domain-containing protein [Bacteroidales bacterium]